MFLAGFDNHRQRITTPSVDLSYVDVGTGLPALFVHGVGTNAYLWSGVVPALADMRRCIAVDLPLHGQSPGRPGQQMTIGAFAEVLAGLCDGLDVAEVDLVAHDTGGAVAQVFAARYPQRLRSLTLTNCDTHDNVPPEAFAPTVERARSGQVAASAPALLANLAAARAAVFATGYENPEFLTLDMVQAFLEPVLGTRAAAEKFQELLAGLEPTDLLAAEPGLRNLRVPTLVVWGTADVFFDVKWAYWLLGTIPGARVVEIAGAKLFFPHERADELSAHIRGHWASSHPQRRPTSSNDPEGNTDPD
jgi:pimeloyl-ACP methyl ester carboxylesterase